MRPTTEQLAIWGSVDVWQSAHVKKIRLPAKLTTLRQKLYRKAKLEPNLNVIPSAKALHAQREALREMISTRQSHEPVPDLIQRVNVQLRGWANHFSFGYPRKAMRMMNWYVRSRLIKHLRRRSQRPFRPPKGRSFYQHLKQLGLIYL
jgi:RNA-directed DNA polymerase